MDLDTLTVVELRAVARDELGPAAWYVGATKTQLLAALRGGAAPTVPVASVAEACAAHDAGKLAPTLPASLAPVPAELRRIVAARLLATLSPEILADLAAAYILGQ